MKKPVNIILFLLVLGPGVFGQSKETGKWVRYNKNISEGILLIADNLGENRDPDSSLFPENPVSGSLCYWNGSEWIIENNDNSIKGSGIIIKIGEYGKMLIGAPLNQPNNDYDIFTKDGWVHVKSRLPYIPGADKLYFDKDNNRFILLKGNDPWIYQLE